MKYRIERDTNPENPRENDHHLGTMVTFHRRYALGDKQRSNPARFLSDFLEKEGDLPTNLVRLGKIAIVLPLYLYDHSGLSIATTPFACKWGSGQVGWIYVTLSDVRKEYGVKRISKKLRERVIAVLNSEVEKYNQYLTGDVWGFVIEDNGAEIDSCWGIYGYENCESEAKSCIDSII